MRPKECQTTRPLHNSPQTTRPRSSDSTVDKRTKNNLHEVKSWVHIFSGWYGSVVDERTRGELSEANCPRGELSGYHLNTHLKSMKENLEGVMASWLVRLSSDRAVLGRALAEDIVLCSWARHFTLTVPLSTQVYKWVPANLMLGVSLRWTSIPSRGSRNTLKRFLQKKPG